MPPQPATLGGFATEPAFSVRLMPWSQPQTAERFQRASGVQAARTRHVQATCNPEAGVWWAESEDLPALASETPTLDALVGRAVAIAGKLLAANGTAQAEVSLQFSATRQVEPA